MKGKLYGVGVGPGEPELLTQKAVRLLRECDVVAAPDGERTAYQIAKEFVEGKPVLFCSLPMTRDKASMRASHKAAADTLCAPAWRHKNGETKTAGDRRHKRTHTRRHPAGPGRAWPGDM